MRQFTGAFDFRLPVDGQLDTLLRPPMVGMVYIAAMVIKAMVGMHHSAVVCIQLDMVDMPLMVPFAVNPRVCHATTVVPSDVEQAAVVQVVALPAVAA
jgi:hypothetical protein